MESKIVLLATMAILTLTGCASPDVKQASILQEASPLSIEEINFPDLNVPTKTNIGAEMVKSGLQTNKHVLAMSNRARFYRPGSEACFNWINKHRPSIRQMSGKLSSGEVIDCYGYVNFYPRLSNGAASLLQGCAGSGTAAICAIRETKEPILLTDEYKGEYHKLIPEDQESILVRKEVKGTYKELIYSGRSGDVLNLVYREFQNDMHRSTFQQNLTYNLQESETIGFRDLRLKVIEASNMEITFTKVHDFGA
jgi:hypothetical protein